MTKYFQTGLLAIIAALLVAAAPALSNSARDSLFSRGSADSLEYVIRNDYLTCTGDTTFVSRERLFAWKKRIDSLVLADKGYREKFNTFVNTTGIKAHEVRPCEPIAFHEQLERQLREMDSIVNAARARKERESKDSTALATELAALKAGPIDIFGLRAGMSQNVVRLLLARDHNIRPRSVQNSLLVDAVKMFDTLTVTVALRFGADGKYTGYEIETAAVRAELLDGAVRVWAALFTCEFEQKMGAPNARSRVGFRDIKQGQLSIVSRWDKDTGKNRPRAAVGLATHNNLYYAKVMVNY